MKRAMNLHAARKTVLVLVLSFISMGIYAQSLKGRVTDESGNPLIGASVVLEGTYQGVSAQLDGSYLFSNLKAGTYRVKVSFIGYEPETREVNLTSDREEHFQLKSSTVVTGEVVVAATRAGAKTPVAVTNVGHDELNNRNLGQDIPVLLSLTPSFVTSTDAGAGVGYSGFRIRGTDANRINITVNGIPVNDSESHGVWWVNMPDFVSSVEDVQVQRGVGTSTNGAGAFGATVNLQTQKLNRNAYAEVSSAAGSFNTYKNTVKARTGLLDNNFAFDVRLSKITSNGYIDRATANLKSFYLSGGYYGEKTMVKANVFSGKEKTYQAWNGVPKVRLENDLTGMQRYADHWLISQEEADHMIASDSRTYNIYTYENEADNYQQDHYQMFFSHKFNRNTFLNVGLHFTHGEGYYEQLKKDDDLEDYGLSPISIGGEIIESTDIIRRKWLNNDFYGAVFSLNHSMNQLNLTCGGGWNKYDGDHYGRIRWMGNAGDAFIGHQWYFSNGKKSDINTYVKADWTIVEALNAFADFQVRAIDYEIEGIDDDLRNITQQHDFVFFNPKIGVNYQAGNHRFYGSFAVANREPNRSNYVDAPQNRKPTSERLFDYELGYNYSSVNTALGVNFYYMSYNDQLIMTGEINDVGSAIMVNVDNSYRTGVEVTGAIKLTPVFNWKWNVTLSENKIKAFTEYVDDWDNGGQIENNLGRTDLAFSPGLTANSMVEFKKGGFTGSFISRYVGDQYIDNTSNNERKLDAYFVSDVKMGYKFNTALIKNVSLDLLINNIFNAEYETNAWVYSYYFDAGRHAMDGYFPQAGTNFLVGLTLSF